MFLNFWSSPLSLSLCLDVSCISCSVMTTLWFSFLLLGVFIKSHLTQLGPPAPSLGSGFSPRRVSNVGGATPDDQSFLPEGL